MSDPLAKLKATLERLGTLSDNSLDLAETALLLGALDRPNTDLGPYREHLTDLAAELHALSHGRESLDDRISLINRVLFERFSYVGDTETYDDIDNANLLSVIDRRLGLPVSLGVLYIHAARSRGWPISGLAFPGHFLTRLDEGPRRVIVDPFHRGQALEAGHLRDLLKQFLGTDAELLPEHYAPVDNRAILLRLQNNIKTRALQKNDAARAIDILERMVLFAPNASPVWHELGVMLAHMGNLKRAVSALETCLDCAPPPDQERQASALLEKLRSSIH